MISGLQIKELAVSRGGRTLFQGLNLGLEAAQACALTGRNGSGKTSLLRAIAGLLEPAGGEITFDGLDSDQARRTEIHLVGHADGLKAGQTARDELTFWTGWTGGRPEALVEAVETLEIGALLDLEVRRLSAGQKRRLALARLLAAPRALWLLDEPLSPLDAVWRTRFGEMMAGHLKTGGMIVAAIHDPLPIPALSLEITP
jgi:heme exporter protein A